MGRLIVFLLGFAVIGGALYLALKSSPPLTVDNAPKRTLDNVHEAADRMEVDFQQKEQDIDRQTEH